MSSQSPKTIHFFKLVRYPNLLIMAATQLLCAVWLTPDEAVVWGNISLWLILLATLCIGAGGYIINDIFDFDADEINKPHKVIINPKNKNQYALAYYGLSIFGILLGLVAGVWVGLVCAGIVALLYYYSYKLKKTVLWGNIAVATMSAAVLLILKLSVPAIETFALITYAAFAFFTTLVREITKDIEDVEGDRAAHYPTLPVQKGVAFAQKIAVAQAIVLLACTIIFAIWCILHLRLWAFYYLVALTVIPTVGLVLLIFWAKEKAHYTQASLLSKLIMLSGIISMYFIL